MNIHSEQIERIKFKLSVAKKKDIGLKVFGAKDHKYKVGKAASEEKINNFEKEYSIELPLCYRSFLAEIGNGGISYRNSSAGPYYGIFSLGSDIDELVENPSKYLSKQCILTPSITDEEWKELNRKIDENEDISDEDYDIERGKIFGGVLPIGSQGCSYIHAIILNGNHKGRVLNLDLDWQKPRFTYEDNFLDWYERWLDEVILGVLHDSPSWFGYGERESKILTIDSQELKLKWSLKFWK